MKGFQFSALLQKEGWMAPAYVSVDTDGRIKRIADVPDAQVSYETVAGFAVPGIPNTHSHAFQYAMAGLAEKHNLQQQPDDFWGWREAMYQLALSVSPDQMEAIASMLYAEMLRHGYTQVAEFHYLHHDKSGKPYSQLAEMGMRLIAAAQKTGIKITLIPIFYQKGGFGEGPNDRQRRFISPDIDAYLRLFDASRSACSAYPDARIAYGVHSMRGVEPRTIRKLTEMLEDDLPFHLHVSEQKKEVQGSLKYLGQRPVAWLLDHVDLGPRYQLVHATHMNESEVLGLARSGAQVVLCPSTEGNLGDGIFPLKMFQHAGGKWSIGTDSHIGLNPFEEFRILDYGQRLTSHHRNIFHSKQESDSGQYALHMAIMSGQRALGQASSDFFAEGQSFDALVLDAHAPLLASSSLNNLSSTLVYASDSSMHLGTLVNGKWMVRNGKHHQGEKIKSDFAHTMKTLQAR